MKSHRILFFFLGWMGMVIYFMQRWIYGPLIPSLMAEFGVDKTTLGTIGAASLWGYMLTPIAAGILSDRFGRKHAVLFGIFGFSALTALCGAITSTGQLFVGRLFTGMVEAFYFIPLLAFTMELFPERPGFFLTFMSSGSSMGWFIGPAFAGWLLDLTGSWRAPFIVTGLAGLAVALLLLLFWPRETKKIRAGAFFDRDILQPSSLVMLLLLGLTVLFQISSEFGFTMWYPVFLKTELGYSATLAGIITGMFGVGQFIGRPLFGFVSDKLGYRTMGIAGGTIMTISLILILSVSSLFLRGLFTFQAGFFGAAVMGAVWTFTGLVFQRYKGLALGIISTFAYALASFALIRIGYIGDHSSVSAGIWSVCIPASLLACAAFGATNFIKCPAASENRE